MSYIPIPPDILMILYWGNNGVSCICTYPDDHPL